MKPCIFVSQQQAFELIRETGFFGTLWGMDIIVSNVSPKVKRQYNKLKRKTFVYYDGKTYNVGLRCHMGKYVNGNKKHVLYECSGAQGVIYLSYYKLKKIL